MSLAGPPLTFNQKRLAYAASAGAFTIGNPGDWNDSNAACAAAAMERAVWLAEELRRTQEVVARLANMRHPPTKSDTP